MLKDESEEQEDESFALDSEEEEKQIQKAINASKKPVKKGRASTTSAGTSSAASSNSRVKGGKAIKRGDMLRTAAAKAAERESTLSYK
jgi:sialic acid synthase SpsE